MYTKMTMFIGLPFMVFLTCMVYSVMPIMLVIMIPSTVFVTVIGIVNDYDDYKLYNHFENPTIRKFMNYVLNG